MVGKDLAAAVNAVNKTTRSNDVPGNEDTEDNDTERNSSYISTNLINHPPANEVTEDMRKIEEAGRRRKEKFLAARRDAKAKFEAKRKIVLDRVPEDYKKMFGQLGFIGWGQAVLPAIIMSPYDVPMGEGSPREKWLIMFSKLEQDDRLESMAYILYWYGCRSPADSYGFVTKSAFITEASKDYHTHMKTLEKAQARVDSNEKVPMATQELARKYKEMLADLLMAPEDRKRGHFLEGYELPSMSGIHEFVSDANASRDDDSSEDKAESKPAPEDRKHGGFQVGYELLSMNDIDILLSDADESGDDDTGEEKAESKLAPRKRGQASTAHGNDIEATLESQGKKMKKLTPPVTVCEISRPCGEITEAPEQPSEKQSAQTE